MRNYFQSPASTKSPDVRHNIAAAMIGSTVGLLIGRRNITHGVVSAVLTEAGMPKLVVDGTRYDLNQILTVTPAPFN